MKYLEGQDKRSAGPQYNTRDSDATVFSLSYGTIDTLAIKLGMDGQDKEAEKGRILALRGKEARDLLDKMQPVSQSHLVSSGD
jgi:hypothetical protein